MKFIRLIDRHERILLLLLFVAAILPIIHLFHPGLPITHDGRDHVARIANFYAALKDGVLIPRWAGNLNWGYGHPVLMFLYPLPSYIASVFIFLGFTYVDSTKIVFGILYVASLYCMYIWLKSKWGRTAGFVGAMLYGYAPYRFVDMNIRGAIGEQAAFVFAPLVCYFIIRIHNDMTGSRNYGISSLFGLTLSIAGLILSHNALSLIFLMFIALYVLFLYFVKGRNFYFILVTVFGFALGFGLSAFFWVPAYIEGKYTLRDIVTKGVLTGRFVSIRDVFLPLSWTGNNGQISTSVGIFHWLAIIVSFCTFGKWKSSENRILTLVSLFLFVITVFFMTSASQIIWSTFGILEKFQFPWRLLSLTVFLTSIIGAVTVHELKWILVRKIPERLMSTSILFYILVILALTVPVYGILKPVGYSDKTDRYYSEVFEGTTDTGESSPIWSVRFMDKRPDAPLESIDNKAIITEKDRSSILHTYSVHAIDASRLVENTLYFPGWEIYIDGEKTSIEFQDPSYRGLMTFIIPSGIHTVTVRFSQTKIRTIADYLSLISCAFLVFIVFVHPALMPIRRYYRKKV